MPSLSAGPLDTEAAGVLSFLIFGRGQPGSLRAWQEERRALKYTADLPGKGCGKDRAGGRLNGDSFRYRREV